MNDHNATPALPEALWSQVLPSWCWPRHGR